MDLLSPQVARHAKVATAPRILSKVHPQRGGNYAPPVFQHSSGSTIFDGMTLRPSESLGNALSISTIPKQLWEATTISNFCRQSYHSIPLLGNDKARVLPPISTKLRLIRRNAWAAALSGSSEQQSMVSAEHAAHHEEQRHPET